MPYYTIRIPEIHHATAHIIVEANTEEEALEDFQTLNWIDYNYHVRHTEFDYKLAQVIEAQD